jgi:hypothetical protein
MKETIETTRCPECGMYVPVGSTHRCLTRPVSEKLASRWGDFKLWLSFQHGFWRGVNTLKKIF